MRKDDLIRIKHMLDAAHEARAFASGKTKDTLEKDRLHTLGLVKEIEIIGEAAGKLSEETRTKYSTIPWIDIISMRNRLIHAYFDIDFEVVWDSVTKDLPPLIAELEKIIESEK